MAEEKNTTQVIILTEHTYINSAWLRKEFNKATEGETEKLIRKYENSLADFLYKRTCFYISISEESRNLKFLTWLCDRLTETAGYQYEAKLVFNDENMESKEAYLKSKYKIETNEKEIDLAKNNKPNVLAESNKKLLGCFIQLSPYDVNGNFNFKTELYYDNFTELVYMQNSYSSGFTPYYYGNSPMRYSKKWKIFYFVTEENIAHVVQEDIYKTFRWYTSPAQRT